MEFIQFIQRHHIDEFPEIGGGEEVPGDVKHHAAPSKRRLVGYVCIGDGNSFTMTRFYGRAGINCRRVWMA